MAITALVKSSTLVVYPNEDTNLARVIEVSGAPTFSDSYDTIERDVVRQAFSTYAPLRGLETTSGTTTLELHGSGEQNLPPESTLLYKAAFGALIGPESANPAPTWAVVDTYFQYIMASDTVTPILWNDGTNDLPFDPALHEHKFVLTDINQTPRADGLKPHMPVRLTHTGTLELIGFVVHALDPGDDDPLNPGTPLTNGEIRVIAEKADPCSADAILDCGFLYSLRYMNGDQVLALQEYTADYYRGDITRETWLKNLSTEFTIDFQTGQVVLPSFNFEGGGVRYGNDDGVDVPFNDVKDTIYGTELNDTFDSSKTSPLIVQLADVYLENKSLTGTDSRDRFYQECVSGIQITLTNEVYKKECIASVGVGEVIRTSRSVTGSLNTFYTGLDFQEAFKQDTQYICRMVFNYAYQLNTSGTKDYVTEPGNIVAISIPQLKFSEVGIEEDTGIFKYANSFSAEPVEGDDELYLAFM
jgi:hypothetical protein